MRWPLAAFLVSLWWILFPAFAVLAGVLSVERACADPYRLIASAMSTPLTAWALSLLYVSAHAWLLAAYVHTTARAGSIWPSLKQVLGVWKGDWLKVALMAAAMAVEYFPVTLWRAIAATVPSLCRLS